MNKSFRPKVSTSDLSSRLRLRGKRRDSKEYMYILRIRYPGSDLLS